MIGFQFLKGQVTEIAQSRALQIYGALLSLSHCLTAYFWMDRSLPLFSRQTDAALCWPFLPNCEGFLFSSDVTASRAISILAAFGILSFFLFLLRKTKWAYILLSLTLVYKLYLTLTTYAVMGNYHYMLFFAHIFYLWVPHKKTLLPFLIAAFYWGAGILKLNPEWLSGEALVRESFLPPLLQHLSLLYAVILECILVFFLFAPNKKLRFFVLLQFMAFHIFSWHIVGYFYPSTMFLLLGVFYLIPLFKEKWTATWDELKALGLKKSSPLFIVLFLQVIPYFFTSDPAMGGVVRLSSLNMLDAKIECSAQIIHSDELSTSIYDPFNRAPSTRTQCDPIIFISQIPRLCLNKDRLDFSLFSKRTTDLKYKVSLHIEDICSKSKMELFGAEL